MQHVCYFLDERVRCIYVPIAQCLLHNLSYCVCVCFAMHVLSLSHFSSTSKAKSIFILLPLISTNHFKIDVFFIEFHLVIQESIYYNFWNLKIKLKFMLLALIWFESVLWRTVTANTIPLEMSQSRFLENFSKVKLLWRFCCYCNFCRCWSCCFICA